MMVMALRQMARITEAAPGANVRTHAKYQEAVSAFYACDFGRANAILTQNWPTTP